MGPKKEIIKKEITKKENTLKIPSIDDPINSSSWNCVVVMAVERSSSDSFVLKDFMEEATKGRRQEVKLINFETFVVKILNDFAKGELPFKYAFLLNFVSVFQDAAVYANNKSDIPVPLLVRVVKALLFFLREESMAKVEKKASGPVDPIKAMSERPADAKGPVEPKSKQKGREPTTGKGKAGAHAGPTVKPPSASKPETKLLKRGEEAKEDQCIDDSPPDGFFQLYVLLTGFYFPDFALELLKAGVPLHGIFCVDTSVSGAKHSSSSSIGMFQKRNSEENPIEIQRFWDSFLKILWDPTTSHYFKDIVFQVYIPQRLTCEKKKLKEFIYKEISYLMYDLSDLKRQLDNYLTHLKLRDVSESKEIETVEGNAFDIDELPNECVTIPILLQHLIDVCSKGEDGNYINETIFSDSIDSSSFSSTVSKSAVTQSVLNKYGSSVATPIWSQVIKYLSAFNSANIYAKTKELDKKYNLEEGYCGGDALSRKRTSEGTCQVQKNRIYTENMQKAIDAENETFGLNFKTLDKNSVEKEVFLVPDYCLYALLFTKLLCFYDSSPLSDVPGKMRLCLDAILDKNSSFESIKNINEEMRKPHFTVTVGSRSVLKSYPYNVKQINKDFFSPSQFKIVSPEMLKVSSAPEFHIRPDLIQNISFVSDLIKHENCFEKMQVNPYENLREFLGENAFANAKNFDFVEELNKTKMHSKESQYRDRYNCVDYTHFFLTGCLLVVLHNRKSNDGTQCETFNAILKTKIGLRDFFEYVLEDESEWLQKQEKLYKNRLTISTIKSPQNGFFKDFTESTFWMDNSIKRQEFAKMSSLTAKDFSSSKIKTSSKNNIKKEISKAENTDKNLKSDFRDEYGAVSPPKNNSLLLQSEEFCCFEGYDVSDMAVQYSGLKTMYFSEECSVTVDLIERLYGNQDLGVHVCQGGHTLHLYSYACPVPHLLDPHTFHISYKNGIFLSFGRRFVETFDEVEEVIEPKVVPNKNKRTSSDLSATMKTTKTRKISEIREDKEFFYDMKLSLPNGLTVAVVRKIVKPCYIKQQYVGVSGSSAEDVARESCRLILPDGTVVKIMTDRTLQVLKANTSILNSSLNNLVAAAGTPKQQNGNEEILTHSILNFTRYEIMTPDGFLNVVNQGKVTSSKKFTIFQNTDMASNTTYYRRMDETHYMLQNEGILCVLFKDGTKMSTFAFWSDETLDYLSNPENEYESEEGSSEEIYTDMDFVIIYVEITVEHPDYATVIFNSLSRRWKILLPYESTITVQQEGCYFINVDKDTELKIDPHLIQMNRFNKTHELSCSATADLTVFEKGQEGGVYCQVEDSCGKMFIVEANSNCYVVQDENLEDETTAKYQNNFRHTSSEDTQLLSYSRISDDTSAEKLEHQVSGFKLSREKKYLVVRKDNTGLEVIHKEEVRNIITEVQKNCLVFTQEIPGAEKLRCFVLISPLPEGCKRKKWEVPSIIPNPRFVPSSAAVTTSSTYGRPPSWMFPFPKRKAKFQIPDRLTCRVFIETRKTELTPNFGRLECNFCEIDDDVARLQHSKIEPGMKNIEKYMKKLSDDDQDMLKEMYALVAREILTEKKKLRCTESPKLQHYLKMSKYYVDLQEYHKKCIRYHDIPNYFHHPAGMSWLILNDWVSNLQLSKEEKQKQKAATQSRPSTLSLDSKSTFSYEEVEYNLVVSSEPSFSDLSYRSDLSGQSAPVILTKGNVCRCKIKDPRTTKSAPIYITDNQKLSEPSIVMAQHKECTFFKEDVDILENTKDDQTNTVMDALEDLMSLGLI